MKYAIVIEKAGDNYSAYVPDLPGCIAAGDSVKETRDLLEEAIRMHLEAMAEDGEQAPEPATFVDSIEVAV